MINLGGIVRNLINGLGGGILGDTTGPVDYKVQVRAPSGIVSAYLPENFSSAVSSDYDTPFTDGAINALGAITPGVSTEQLKLGFRMAGMSTTTQAMTMQVWQGSAPMDFSIPVQFLLNSDSEKDIIGPMRALMAMTLPSGLSSGVGALASNGGNLSGTEGFLQSPGPKLRLKKGVTPQQVAERAVTGIVDSGKAVYDYIGSAGQDGASQELLDKLHGSTMFGLMDIYDNISLQLGSFMYFPSVVITDVSSDYEIKLDRYSRKPIALNATIGFRTFVTPKAEDLHSILQ